MSDKKETDKAIKEMFGIEETEEAKSTEVVNTTDETNEGATTDTETDSQKAEDDKVDTFDRKYVENLRNESARYRNEAKESKERLATLEATIQENEKTIESANKEVSRWKIAAKYGVSEEDVNLFLTASDEETLEKQAQRLSSTSAHAPRPDGAQGRRTETGPVSVEQQGAAALKSIL